MEHKFKSACRRLALLDNVYVAAHNALQLPRFRHRPIAEPEWWMVSRFQERAGIAALERAVNALDWFLPAYKTRAIEDIYRQAQCETRMLVRGWECYVKKINQLARTHHHKKYAYALPQSDYTLYLYSTTLPSTLAYRVLRPPRSAHTSVHGMCTGGSVHTVIQ